MIISINEVEVRKSNVKDFVEAVEFLLRSVSIKKGCLRSDVFYDQKDITTVIVYHEWESMDFFKAYIQSGQFKQLLSLYELSLKKPVLKILECHSVKELSWIENVMLEGPLEEVGIDE